MFLKCCYDGIKEKGFKMTKEEIKKLANKELSMYDLSEILDDVVLDFFFKYLYNNTKDSK